MGTRGYLAFIYKGKLYKIYNHWDSYPQRPGLGWQLVREICWGNLERWKKAIENLKFCTGTPTEEDIQNLREYTDLSVSEQSTKDWYCLTRKCQGGILKILQSGYFNGSCEDVPETLTFGHVWSYLLDFDNNKFRIWQGDKEYPEYACPLDGVKETMFNKDWVDAWNKKHKEGEAEDEEKVDDNKAKAESKKRSKTSDGDQNESDKAEAGEAKDEEKAEGKKPKASSPV